MVTLVIGDSGNVSLRTDQRCLSGAGRRLAALLIALAAVLPLLQFMPGAGAILPSDFTFEDLPDTIESIDAGDIAVDPRGVVHIVYAESSYEWVYANNDGGTWQSQRIPYPATSIGDGYYYSLAIDSSYCAHVSYALYLREGVWGSYFVYATNAGGSWQSTVLETCEDTSVWAGDASSIALDSQGDVHIAYVGTIPGSNLVEYLKYATNEGGTWSIEPLDWLGEAYYESVSMVLDQNDAIHISCLFPVDSSWAVHTLQYVTNAGGGWSSTIVDTNVYSWFSGIAVDGYGAPSICYMRSALTYASFDSGSWQKETVDPEEGGGIVCSLALDSFGCAHIGYVDAAWAPKYATNEGGSWNTTRLSESETVSYTIAVAVDSMNRVHVFYKGVNANGLVYAYRDTIPPIPVGNRLEFTPIVHYPLVGATYPITVTIYDQFGGVFSDYSGTVSFSTNRTGDVSLPSDYTFKPGDKGTHTFTSGAEFLSPGLYSISCSDDSNSLLFDVQTDIRAVSSPPVASACFLDAPESAVSNLSFSATLTVCNEYGETHEGYTGTVHFSTSDPGMGVALPADYTFTAEDAGMHAFASAFALATVGTQTLSVQDTATPGLSASVTVQVSNEMTTYRIYDMFQEPQGEWWESYGLISDDPGMNTYAWGYDLIYAPYRYSIEAVGVNEVRTGNPEFMPLLGTPGVAGSEVSIDLYMQYLDTDWMSSYWIPEWGDDPNWVGEFDPWWTVGAVYNITMNREAALEWLGMPMESDPLTWWTANEATYEDAWNNWVLNEGNSRLDIHAAYYWGFCSYSVMTSMQAIPSGDIHLTLAHIADGFEILMTRWLSEANLTALEPFWEDFSLTVQYGRDGSTVLADGVVQNSLHAVKANDTYDCPAWAWEPNKIDYFAMYDHPSDYNPYESLSYQSWNAGSYVFGEEVYYEYTPSWFNLSASEVLIFDLPSGTVPGFKGVPVSTDDWYAFYNGDSTRLYEIMRNGTMDLGNCVTGWPSGPDLSSMYDPVARRLTIAGPLSFDNARHTENGALYHGAPWIEFDVTPENLRMDHLEVAVTDNPTYSGAENSLIVTAVDQYGDPFPDFAGTVTFSSSDPAAVLPDDYTFVPASDAGVHEFAFAFSTIGEQYVTVADVADPAISGTSGAIAVISEPEVGVLRVYTIPLVPAMIYVDGNPTTRFQIEWMELPIGTHTISYGDAIGFMAPPDIQVEVSVGSVTMVEAQFQEMGVLDVSISPHVQATIYVNGIARNDWGLQCYVPPGVYVVSFGAVAGYTTPAPMTVPVFAGSKTAVTGLYIDSPGAPGPDPNTFGRLRVETTPSLPATVFVDGQWMNCWGLDWVKVTSGYHTVSFGDVPGYVTPQPIVVYVPVGGVGTVSGAYVKCSVLRIQTDPAVPTTISLNGLPRNAWGLWVDLFPGTYVATFSPVEGYITPDPLTIVIAPDSFVEYVVTFEPSG